MTSGFYKVCWIRDGQEIAQHAFEDLLTAKRFAKERLQIQKIRRGANIARVIDSDGVQYFEFRF